MVTAQAASMQAHLRSGTIPYGVTLPTEISETYTLAYKTVYPPDFARRRWGEKRAPNMNHWYSPFVCHGLLPGAVYKAQCNCYSTCAAPPPPGPIPHSQGSCGFYAWKVDTIVDPTSQIFPKPLLARVYLGGRIIQAEHGYRAEYIMLLDVSTICGGPPISLEEGNMLFESVGSYYG